MAGKKVAKKVVVGEEEKVELNDVQENFIRLLESGIDNMKKHGYCILDLGKDCLMFCNQNYAEVSIPMGEGVYIKKNIKLV